VSQQECRHYQDPDCKLLLEPGSTEGGVSCNRYLENVPTIVPLLEREFRSAAAKLHETQVQLGCHVNRCFEMQSAIKSSQRCQFPPVIQHAHIRLFI
jgi:hypothetical protein